MKMFGALFVLCFITVITVLVTRDAMSAPQIGLQIGEIHNNGTGGGNVTPQGSISNSTASVPGSGYPDAYYSSHSNDSAPTSPTMDGDSLNLENSTLATSTCDCNHNSNGQQTNNAPSNGPSDNDNPARDATKSSKQ